MSPSLQRHVQRHVAGLQLGQVDPDDSGSDVRRRRLGVLPRRGTMIDFAAGDRSRRAGAGERGQQRHVAGQLVFARRAHFAHDQDALAAVVLDRDRHLRVLQIPVRQLRLQLLLRARAA